MGPSETRVRFAYKQQHWKYSLRADISRISQIAARASVYKGLMYNYFEGKEHLLEQVIKSLYEEGVEDFEVNR